MMNNVAATIAIMNKLQARYFICIFSSGFNTQIVCLCNFGLTSHIEADFNEFIQLLLMEDLFKFYKEKWFRIH